MNTIKLNTHVKVVPSDDLSQMHLSGMVGRTGKVAEQIFSTDGSLIGYMVFLDKSFQGECLWFVPQDALVYEEDTE